NASGARSGTATIGQRTLRVTQGADACGALDVTPQTAVRSSGLTYIPFSTYFYSANIFVTNKSQSVIRGPVFVVLIGLPTDFGFPDDAGLLGDQLLTKCFTSGGLGDYLLLVSPEDMPAGKTVGIPEVFWTQSLSNWWLLSYSTKV